MSEDIWYEDALAPQDPTAVRGQVDVAGASEPAAREITARVSILLPRWRLLGDAPLTSGEPATLWLVRLRFQFAAPAGSARYVFARCEAFLDAPTSGEPQPTVYELYPTQVQGEEPHGVALSVGPTFGFASISIPIAEVTGDLMAGHIYPDVVSNLDEDERNPTWDLRPRREPLLGLRDFWVVAAQPSGCSVVRVRARADAVVQTRWGPIALAPAQRFWTQRPFVELR